MPKREALEYICPPPEIDDAAVSKLAKELKVFYTYVILTPRNNSIYAGLSRQDPDKKMNNMAQRVRWAPEFEGFWGYYDIAVLDSELNEEEAVEAEKRIIKKLREGTRYKAINKSTGGETGYPLKRAISNNALKKYYSYLRREVRDQDFSMIGLWEMDPRPMLSMEIQFPRPAKYFKTITECIEEVSQDFIAEHLGCVASNRSCNLCATEKDELLVWLD